MKLIEQYPDFATIPTETLLQKVSRDTLFATLPDVSELYSSALQMRNVLKYYGQDHISSGETERQVNCLWMSHGSVDKNRSARYFSTDRKTGETRGAVYCYKCQRSLTSFWYTYRMEADIRGLSLNDTILFIERTFGVKFPRGPILEFDYDKFYSFSTETANQMNTLVFFEQAAKVRSLKEVDLPAFCQSLYALYMDGAIEKSV